MHLWYTCLFLMGEFMCSNWAVNLIFSVSGFEFTSESGLFDLFDVALYHGWLVDPQDKETYQVVSHCSYNQLVEMVVNNSNSKDINEMKNGKCSPCWWYVHVSLDLDPHTCELYTCNLTSLDSRELFNHNCQSTHLPWPLRAKQHCNRGTVMCLLPK